VTHPFHPLRGRELELADHRTAWGEDRVYVYGDAGQLLRLPAVWTDFAEPDPFVVTSGGRSVLHGDDLLRLAALVARVAGPAEQDCKRNDAATVSEMMPKGRADRRRWREK
jgi:hypothetical protein